MAQIREDLAEQSQEQEKHYLLPDGFGLDLDKVRELVLKLNNTNIPKDDPTLVVVTILNAFLSEQHTLQEAYRVALEKVYQQVLNNFVIELDKRVQTTYVAQIEKAEKQKQENTALHWCLYGLVVLLSTVIFGIYLWKF